MLLHMARHEVPRQVEAGRLQCCAPAVRGSKVCRMYGQLAALRKRFLDLRLCARELQLS